MREYEYLEVVGDYDDGDEEEEEARREVRLLVGKENKQLEELTLKFLPLWGSH